MVKTIDELRHQWQQRLIRECLNQTERDRQSILDWLLGEDPHQWATSTQQLAILNKNIEDRFGILHHGYLDRSKACTYKHLMCRAIALLPIRAFVGIQMPLTQDDRRTILDTAEKVVLNMLQRDRDIQRQIHWIVRCTDSSQLRDTLLFASLEEYLLQMNRSAAAMAVNLHASMSSPTERR